MIQYDSTEFKIPRHVERVDYYIDNLEDPQVSGRDPNQ